MLKKQVSPKIVAIVFAVIVVCFAIAVYVSAWTEPSVVPPGANVAAPLNVSNIPQIKAGSLRLGGLTIDNDTYLATVAGNVGIGTVTPGYKLDINGDINIPSTGFLRIGGSAGLSGQALVRTATGMAWQIVSGGGGITSLSSGSGITLTPDPITSTGAIAVNTGTIQARVSGTCAVGSSIRVISSTGTVTCETDDGSTKSVLVIRAMAPAAVGACPAGWTDGGTGSAWYAQGSQTNERYCYRTDFSCRIITMRAAAPAAAGACPAGWTNGGTGGAYYGQASQTNERYCYACP